MVGDEARPNVLILGAPGAGKGTQSANLEEAYGIEHVTTGDILRENRDMETEYGTPREFMEAGELVPDPVVNDIVRRALADADGFVLDGYPRNMEQAAVLDEVAGLDVVLYLDVSEDELLKRITGRRVCEECGANYHIHFDQPEETGVCDECGGRLIQRDDDTEETARERLRVFEENTRAVIEHYDRRGELVRIDGEQPPAAVWEDIEAAVDAVIG